MNTNEHKYRIKKMQLFLTEDTETTEEKNQLFPKLSVFSVSSVRDPVLNSPVCVHSCSFVADLSLRRAIQVSQ